MLTEKNSPKWLLTWSSDMKIILLIRNEKSAKSTIQLDENRFAKML